MQTEPKRLGDPHLGRRFNKSIPVERRGQREQLVREDFVRQLEPDGASAHICMGDLFDKPQVSYADVQFAYRAYRAAAAANPRTTFFIIQGNHDDSRDLDEVTAWDVFCDNVEGVRNIVTVTEAIVSPPFVLLPWHPTMTASDMLGSVVMEIVDAHVTTAYGHWDVDPRTAGHNIIPTKELAELGIAKAYTGHVHKPESFRRDGVDVTVVGSMQPYAQGEDGGQSGHIRYVTLTLEGLEALTAEQAEDVLANACVRLQLAPGEQFDGDIPPCMSWDIQRLRPVEADAPADVSMEGFDTRAAFQAALEEHEIIPEVRSQIDQRYSEVFGAAG